MSVPHPAPSVYRQIANRPGLFLLLAYALTHRHSRQWIGPLSRLLAKGGD